MPRRAWRWFALAAAVIVADQLVKALVLATFTPYQPLRVTDFFNLVLVFNKGAAFSFLAQQDGWQRWGLSAFALAASGVLAFLIARNASNLRFAGGCALILGGALGNAIDRLRFGHVVDFVQLHAAGWYWPAFNVADSAITVGAGLLIYDSLFPAVRK